MHKLICQRCENESFTAAKDPYVPCPYCGFSMKTLDQNKRVRNRSLTQKVCDILKGEVSIPVKTVDISDTGIGIKMMGYLPFDQNEVVNVHIKELELQRPATVIWTKKFYGISRAGLRFC